MNIFSLFKKKTSEQPKVKTLRNRLRVYFKDSIMEEWWLDDYTSSNIIAPWKDFILWYFRENSKEYLFKSKNAIKLIRKEDIRKFMIDIIEVEK
jgi:hypothetical protein